MALKDLLLSSLPQYCESLPSGKKICFRPMVVSEEKALMLAKSSGDKLSILKTLENILTSCIQEYKKGEVKKLKLTDVEYLFLQLRAKSIGESEGVTIICPYTKENISLKINILKDIIVNTSTPNNKIKIADNLLVVMQEPNMEILSKAPDYSTNEESFYKFISLCIKQIQTKIEVKNCEDISDKEIIEFLKTMTPEQFKKIINYFETCPSLSIIKKYKTSDGIERETKIKGLFNYLNFFFEHITINLFYTQQFQLKYFHNYSIEDMDNMIPWERIIHVEQLKQQLEEKRKIKLLERNTNV